MASHKRLRLSKALGLALSLGLGVFLVVPGPGILAEGQERALGRPAPGSLPETNSLDARLAKLKRGINASHWFAQVIDPRGYTKEHLATHITAADLALIKSLGFDHLRLSVDPAPIWRSEEADVIAAEHLGALDQAVAMILAHGLAVIVDIHPSSDYKKKLQTDDAQIEAFVDFWRTLARNLAVTDPERVFLEVLNEPEFRDSYRWGGIQAKLAAAIRRGAPEHTIIATGHRWSAIDDLLALEPLADRNVVYTFHFYAPALFTHQGATWGLGYWRHLRDLPYPASPAELPRMTAGVPDDLTRLYLMRYSHERWSAERIEAEIGQAAAWAARHNVRVTCNEFGVYRRWARPHDRARWIGDVRAALERHGIGWTMWDYAGDFGMVTKQADQILAEDAIVRALGLPGAGGNAPPSQ
jgi:endoglucanase